MDIVVGNWVYYDNMNPYHPDYTRGIVVRITEKHASILATVQWEDGLVLEYDVRALVKI